MPWTIAHTEHEDGTTHVCKLAYRESIPVEDGEPEKFRTTTHQLKTAIVIPPPGPGHGEAIAALKAKQRELLDPPPAPDVTPLEEEMNAEDE